MNILMFSSILLFMNDRKNKNFQPVTFSTPPIFHDVIYEWPHNDILLLCIRNTLPTGYNEKIVFIYQNYYILFVLFLKGVETTRRFLLEWLSFLHRYVPVGLLVKPPQRMNERVPDYRGRGDLETLLASPKCSDWIGITEMFLGKVPEGFAFEPKHKAHGYKSG